YLDEEEVPAFVSALIEEDDTAVVAPTGTSDERLGIKNGWFRWNLAVEPPVKPKSSASWKFWKRRQADGSQSVLPTATNGNVHQRQDTDATAVEVPRFELQDINIIFPTGKLSLVTGPTASGKSALLMALLGEMTPVEQGASKPVNFLPKHPTQLDQGTGLRNSVAYCAQTPWLEHLTIRDNILFGSPFEKARYDQVIEQCALKPDLDILEDGDMTEIGARGVSLSGGQKARVALARAVYSRSKHILLDDPLSAVSYSAPFG
ncbi:related to multidrug resistance protein, partial [Serendipita indica DSM 11827]